MAITVRMSNLFPVLSGFMEINEIADLTELQATYDAVVALLQGTPVSLVDDSGNEIATFRKDNNVSKNYRIQFNSPVVTTPTDPGTSTDPGTTTP